MFLCCLPSQSTSNIFYTGRVFWGGDPLSIQITMQDIALNSPCSCVHPHTAISMAWLRAYKAPRTTSKWQWWSTFESSKDLGTWQVRKNAFCSAFPLWVPFGGHSHIRCSVPSSAAGELFTSTLSIGRLLIWQTLKTGSVNIPSTQHLPPQASNWSQFPSWRTEKGIYFKQRE